MIRQIRGKVLSADPLGATIEIAGFGIYVAMAAPEAVTEGSEATLHTYLAVKQDGLELYGFPDAADLAFF